MQNAVLPLLRCAFLVSAITFPLNRLFAGELEDYVRQTDTNFAWRVRETMDREGLHIVTLDLTSQQWRGGLWKHTLYIAEPRAVSIPSVVFLRVAAGASNGYIPTAKRLAEQSGTRVAVLTDVPNQPLFQNLREDALIAYTFDQYLKTGDATWPLLLPMTKSAVRAMDAIQAWAQSERQQKVERFVVSGASKRGWTTWLTGAADPRVCAIAPMVIDMLNMKAQAQWAQRVYGAQSEKIANYTQLGLIEKMDLPQMAVLRGIVDPYSYRDRLTMPKLLLLGTNDPYWTVDSLHLYWDDLPAPKDVYQSPNTGHNAGDTHETMQTLAAFLQLSASGQKLPQLTWRMDGSHGGTVAVTADQPAKQATLWTADSATRDFRQAKWSRRALALDASRTHAAASVAAPAAGFTAFMAELTFATPTGKEYRLSTQVQVTPTTF